MPSGTSRLQRRQCAGLRERRHAARNRRLVDARRRRLGARSDGARPQRPRASSSIPTDRPRSRSSPAGSATPSAPARAATSVLVSESWRHRLRLDRAGRSADADRSRHLPVYPSRLSPAAGGGFWLTAFTARTQLVEFVLREPAYRTPHDGGDRSANTGSRRALSSGNSFKEPMQGAHIKTMGVMKPWAPPRSYGLVIRLDARRPAALFAAQPRRRHQPRHRRRGRDAAATSS